MVLSLLEIEKHNQSRRDGKILLSKRRKWHDIGSALSLSINENIMATTTNATGVLNDLIEINNDRIAGFEKAIADIKDENIDLKEIFQRYAEQSRKNSEELAAKIGDADEVETGSSVSGTLHRTWIDVKSLFGGSDRASILAEAERGEDAIKKAYQDALNNEDLPADARVTVQSQAEGIYAAHDQIKAMRDAAKI